MFNIYDMVFNMGATSAKPIHLYFNHWICMCVCHDTQNKHKLLSQTQLSGWFLKWNPTCFLLLLLLLLRDVGIRRSQSPGGLRCGSSVTPLLELLIRIPPGACECCVLSGRGLCIELITRPEESYRVWCVWELRVSNEEDLTHLGALWGLLCLGEKNNNTFRNFGHKRRSTLVNRDCPFPLQAWTFCKDIFNSTIYISSAKILRDATNKLYIYI